VETARGNIDIGGPCMIRAAAKNFIRVASVVDPGDYEIILKELTASGCATSLKLRFQLAQKAFDHTATYDRAIATFLRARQFSELKTCYAIPV
jgi:phosphoribosylaminoimidazolecarboxamide formyltransferase/IMP cyclohydrolase